MRTIDVHKMTDSEMLIGRGGGRRDFPKFVEATFAALEGETVLWDWSGIRVATASYFAAAFVPVMKMLVSGGLDKYFVLHGLNINCEDELKFVLESEGLVTLVADEVKGGRVLSARPLGKLDSVHAETLNRVVRKPGISAKRLYAESISKGRTKIGMTAWINRLVSLYRLRLIKRKRVGRQFTYAVPYVEV
jgi:hypothetical protein